tara:strand:+ start:7948 stop:8931 length:984 start_codon:yes stop_codon:yes gene_type:complete
MNNPSLTNISKNAIIADTLLVCNFDRGIFEEMKKGGITVANCTCCVWEDFHDTMKSVAHWKRLFNENADLIMQVKTVEDIYEAAQKGLVGIILGWQNTSGIDDNIDFLEVYADLGVKIMQLTYNTQNFVASGCFEERDSGLTGFGRDVVAEMNRLGILIDLSHVGTLSAKEACEASTKPLAYTHCCPSALKDHPRNKSDEELLRVANGGGYIGITIFPPFLPNGTKSTIDDYIEVVEYVINLVGEESVGIGTDMSQGHPWTWQEYAMHDKGNGRRLTTFGELKFPTGIEQISDFPNILDAMKRRGWKESKIERVIGQNWVRLLKDVW